MKRLSNEGELRTATVARISHLARAILYDETRPPPTGIFTRTSPAPETVCVA